MLSQDPGYNHGDGDVRGTGLHDYPVSPNPSVFTFQTMVEADKEAWGTVKWGFTTVSDRSEIMEVETTEGPTFVEGKTAEMRDAIYNFNDIMANPDGYTSPEFFKFIKDKLASKEEPEKEEGV